MEGVSVRVRKLGLIFVFIDQSYSHTAATSFAADRGKQAAYKNVFTPIIFASCPYLVALHR